MLAATTDAFFCTPYPTTTTSSSWVAASCNTTLIIFRLFTASSREANPMYIDELSAWKDTTPEHRGEDYQSFKKEKAEQILRFIRGHGINLSENLIKLRDKNGTTIIIVSHSMENTAKISDKIMVMNVGKCEMFGTPKEIFSQEERLSELSLGIPQITRIMKSLKQRGCTVRDDILTVNEAFVELISLLSRRENL